MFSDFPEQTHIIQVLQRSLERDRLAHAYLFSGPRGSGKTSAAKILARCIECVPNVFGYDITNIAISAVCPTNVESPMILTPDTAGSLSRRSLTRHASRRRSA